MEITHEQRVAQLNEAFAGRALYYFGTRGTDAAPLTALESFTACFSQVAPLEALGVRETCLETLTNQRVDLDTYAIDEHEDSASVQALRRAMLDAFETPGHVMAYRSTAVLASAWFPRSEFVSYHALFHEVQACFEHKPWVESALAASGVAVVRWKYFCDDERTLIEERAQKGPLVLRSNRSDGGTGVSLARGPADVDTRWPAHDDGFVAVADYLYPSTPLNINACVWRDGRVSLHGPSVQLIGVPGCTTRSFGYCGNDFAAVADLPPRYLDAFETLTRQTGEWLASKGYCGAFGVDALIHNDEVLLMELNPRFQGSSRLAAELDRTIDRPNQFLEHLAAFLDLPPSDSPPLRELVASYPPRAHTVVHNCSAKPVRRRSDAAVPETAPDLLPAPGVVVDPGAILMDLVAHERVLGHDMTVPASRLQTIEEARSRFYFSA